MFTLMLDCATNLDTYLEALKVDDIKKEIDMKELSSKFTIDMIGCTAFGLNVNSLNNPNNEFYEYGTKIFRYDYIHSFKMMATFFLPTIVRLTGLKTFPKCFTSFITKVFSETINERIESGAKRHDLIDILIELKETQTHQNFEGFTFDGDDLIAQAGAFFIGGYESSSTTIAFTLHELAVNPEIQDRLRKEILDALNESDGKITYDMVLSLPYLDMVVSEALRMYPTLPLLDRVATETYKIPKSDLVLEKGTPIVISMLGMHMDPEFFPNPEKFDPEQFNEQNKRNRPSCVYLPFGEGPRACIGIRLGLLQTKLGIIKILSNYEVTPSKRTMIPMVINPKGISTTPLNADIYLNIKRISTNY